MRRDECRSGGDWAPNDSPEERALCVSGACGAVPSPRSLPHPRACGQTGGLSPRWVRSAPPRSESTRPRAPRRHRLFFFAPSLFSYLRVHRVLEGVEDLFECTSLARLAVGRLPDDAVGLRRGGGEERRRRLREGERRAARGEKNEEQRLTAAGARRKSAAWPPAHTPHPHSPPCPGGPGRHTSARPPCRRCRT